MPFDALLLRALENRWQSQIPGMHVDQAMSDKDHIWLVGKQHSQQLLIVLAPGLARMHWTTGLLPKKSIRTMNPFLQRLVPFEIMSLEVPPFERWIKMEIIQRDDFDQPQTRFLIVELAGHLTNLILLDQEHRILDAFRKIAPSRPGRVVWPGHTYQPPPVRNNPCQTHNQEDLTPWAKRLYTHGSWSWDKFCQDWQQGTYQVYRLTPLQGTAEPELWVYPMPGYEAKPVSDLDSALDELFRAREKSQQLKQMKAQLMRLWSERAQHLEQKLVEYRTQILADPAQLRQLGDLWLAYQYNFKDHAAPHTIEVPSLVEWEQTVKLTLPSGETPLTLAESHYREARKQEARKKSLSQLMPQIEGELALLGQQIEILHQDQVSPEWVAQELQSAHRNSPKHVQETSQPYRRFKSQSGYPLWVGRSREENAQLTFRDARPDDMWFHVKQSPGSHVILGCGKANPTLEDLLDAAELAVFYSQASQSSMVPVDYTRRKFVRKRPHAEPGQVLYRQEKTLYITPDVHRLKKLGAVREKLAQE